MTPLPPAPWHTLRIDSVFHSPCTREYLLVAINAYSRLLEVEIVQSTSASTTIPKLVNVSLWHMAFLLSCAVTIDHHSQATCSRDTRRTTASSTEESLHCSHKPTLRWWSHSQKIYSLLMHTEGKKWAEHLHRFLLNYRTTPHTTTCQAPATLFINRQVRNKLPQLTPKVSDKQLKETDQKAETKMKNYADTRWRALSHCVCQLGAQFSFVSRSTTSSPHNMIHEPLK